MAALPDEEQRFPDPLEFFKQDKIHADNQAILENEEQRWRLLGRIERYRLRRYVASLRRQLHKGGYNKLVIQLHKLKEEYARAIKQYKSTIFIDDDAKRDMQKLILQIRQDGREVRRRLDELKPVYANFAHYQGWLDYEAEHRKDLKAAAKREKKIRREMEQEAKWLESLMLDVFRRTPGCHYIKKDRESGKEKTITPKFERSVIMPDAHHFYLATSRRFLFGYRWRLPYGVTVPHLTSEDVLQNLRAALKRQVDVIWSDTGQLIFRVSRLDSPDALPRKVLWRDAMKFFPQNEVADYPYTIGVTEGRKFRWFNFGADANVLVAGTQGSGKSNLVNGIIATLVSTHSPAELRLVMIDQKGGIEFTHWTELPHLLWEMIKTVEEVEPMLQRVVALMKQRMELFAKVGAKTFPAYNARVMDDQKLERILIVIDEMSTFVGLGETTQKIHNLIMLISSQGRAIGVNMIAATQHPSVDVIPGRIKTNFNIRLCGRMPTASASQTILTSDAASKIPKLAGRFVVAAGMDEFIVQCPMIPDDEISGVVGALLRKYPDVANELHELAHMPAPRVWDEQRVLRAALEFLDGRLGAKDLHSMHGEESPGERRFVKLVNAIRAQVAAVGFIINEEDGVKYTIKGFKKAYYLRELSPNNDNNNNNDTESPEMEEAELSLEASH